jgi:hypothetical protein
MSGPVYEQRSDYLDAMYQHYLLGALCSGLAVGAFFLLVAIVILR